MMFKQSPSRNQRSKGFKVKHALQIGLLLAVCIWLLYQVKHSHDKKKAFDESNAKLLEKMESDREIIKFGRKDLHPRVEESISENEGHNEEEETEEEENKHEEEEENKHEEVEEEEGEENKPEENEDEGRGGGDDELDENDRERVEEEAKREEGFVDEEEKESEDRENGEKEEQFEDQDHDRNTQEAREEQYKGDDASSAVVRDTQGMNSETENGVGEKSNEEEHVEKLETDELRLQNKTSSIEEVTDHNDNLKTGDGEIVEGNLTLNATNGEGNGHGITLSELENGSQPNSTTNIESTDQPEVNNNSTAENGGILSSSMQNGTDISQDQTVVMLPSYVGESNLQTVVPGHSENSNVSSETVESDSNSTLSTTTENKNTSNGESAEEQTVKSNTTAGEVDSSVSSVTNENSNGDQKNESDTTAGAEEAEDNSSSLITNDNVDSVESNSVDANDTLIPEVKEARTDLSTLPETVTEGTNSEDAAEK